MDEIDAAYEKANNFIKESDYEKYFDDISVKISSAPLPTFSNLPPAGKFAIYGAIRDEIRAYQENNSPDYLHVRNVIGHWMSEYFDNLDALIKLSGYYKYDPDKPGSDAKKYQDNVLRYDKYINSLLAHFRVYVMQVKNVYQLYNDKMDVILSEAKKVCVSSPIPNAEAYCKSLKDEDFYADYIKTSADENLLDVESSAETALRKVKDDYKSWSNLHNKNLSGGSRRRKSKKTRKSRKTNLRKNY